MTEHRTVDERISMWLEAEAQGQLPDRVLDATFDRTRALRQRPGPSAWRPFTMSRPFASMLAVGAAAIVLVVAFNVLRPPATNNVGASPSANPTSVVTASPEVSAAASNAAGGPLGLALVNLDGSIKRDLGLPRDAWTADLSADGTKVAFTTKSIDVGFCGGCGAGLGSHRVAIVDVGARMGSFVYPDHGPSLETATQFAWSPDGRRLAFQADDGGNLDIYVLDVKQTEWNPAISGGSVRRLTTSPATDEFPAWTPDGTSILYDNAGATPLDSSGFSPTQEVWRVSANGGTPVRLTNNDIADFAPDVSPDGVVIFWDGGDVWTMDMDGKNQRRLDAIPSGLGFNPRWSPDGSKVALLQFDPTERAWMDPELGLPTDFPLLKVVVVEVATGAMTEVGPRVPSDVNPVSWMPDGSSLLVYRYDHPS